MAETGATDTTLGLTLETLSCTYVAGRSVVRLSQIDTCSTYAQLSARLMQIAKDKERLKELYDALEKLSQHTRVLGLTTLIQPAEHPLVVREEWRPRER